MDEDGTVEYSDDGEGGGITPSPGDVQYDVAGLYEGFVKSFYDATRIMLYDGTVTVHDSFDHVCGGGLSIKGGLKEWETMRSIIQEVSLNLQTGVRELGKLYVAKLQELGLATKRAINGLKEELNQGLRGINAQIDAIGKWANTAER